MSFPRYESYKDSGVEWLGEVPEHWIVTSLKRGFDVRLGKMLQTESSSPDDELLPYLRAANIHWSGIDVSDVKMMWFSSKERVQLTLLPNDLLISEGGDVGRSAMWNSEIDNCHFQNSVNRVRALEGNSSGYLYYWISVIKDKGYIDVLCNKSTIAHFTAEKVQAVPVPFPSSSEQQTITAFLDSETAKTDALIAEQQRLIELLKEKRQAVISHAVTKGLNPDAPMKDSGIEWLGDVPAHWDVMQLRRITNLQQGLQIPQENRFEEDGVNRFEYITIRSINAGSARVHKEFIESPSRRVICSKNDVLLARTGATGEVITNVSGVFHNNFFKVNYDEKLISKDYLVYFLKVNEVKNHLLILAGTTTIPDLNHGAFLSTAICLPETQEQDYICKYLDEKLIKLDLISGEASTLIDLLTERRSALISAAVTGKIDVRGLVSTALPEEAAA